MSRSLSVSRLLTAFAVSPFVLVMGAACESRTPIVPSPTKPAVQAPAKDVSPSSMVALGGVTDSALDGPGRSSLASTGDAAMESHVGDELVVAPSLLSLEALPHPDEGVQYLQEGDDLFAEGRHGEALIAYRHALYDDDSPGVWAKIGRAYLKVGERDRAITSFEASVEKADDRGVRTSLVRAYLDEGNGAGARVHAEALAKTGAKDDAEAQYLLGRTYMKLAMWREAVEAFEAVVEKEPENIWAHNNLGFSAIQIGANELAVTHLEHCLDLEPKKPYMLNNLGVAYERLGRGPEAVAAFGYATELLPSYVNAKLNKQRAAKNLTDEELELSAAILDDMKAPVADGTVAQAPEAPKPQGE